MAAPTIWSGAAAVPSRVLILSWEYPPIVEGGLARHVRKLSEQLVALGIEVHVLTRGGGRLRPVEDRHGVTVHRVREPDFPKDDLDAFISWVEHMNDDMGAAGAELAARLDFDLVHSHDWLVAGAARELARGADVPWLVTVHATEYGRHQGWVDKHPQSHIHAVERRMVRDAGHVISCSHYMRRHVADVFGIPAGRITAIANGIDPTDLQPVADLPRLRARYAAPEERLILLVGRLVYEKGFHLALDALGGPDGVIERLGDVRFLIAGSGTAEAELKEQAKRLGLMRHGSFVGWTGDDELHSLYRIADLCVVPSIYEPFGLVALEAMASGCPCIVADTGGLREVVPGGRRVGLRFRARDPRSLARVMETLLTDDALRDRLVAEAREHVLRFDWADVARQTAEVYGEVTGAATTA
jgi:glycogen(starch) synthase